MSLGGAPSRPGSSLGVTAGSVRRLAEWTGRLLLVGLVAFWWGAVIAPQLVSLAFPSLLPWGVLPLQFNPDVEGSVANTVSALSLLVVALLALGNAVVNYRRGAGLIAVGGWTALAVTTALLAWEESHEVVGFRSQFLPAAGQSLFGDLWSHTSGIDITLVMSPLIVAFAVAMWFFFHKKLSARAVRAPLTLGIAAWLLVVVWERGVHKITFPGWTYTLSLLLEETLEFSGTLLIGLGAGLALGSEAGSRLPSGVFRGRSLFLLAAGSVAVVAVLGGLVAFEAAFLYREQLVDTRGRVVFNVSLYDNPAEEHSVVQELGVPAGPVGRLRLRVTVRDPQGHSGTMLWRVMEAGEGGSGPILREGRMEVAAGDHPRWSNIDFPPLVEAEGRPLAVQLVAEVEPEAHLRIGGTKTNRLDHLRFWINGMETWPDQKLEVVAYGPRDLTLSKFQGVWSAFRWSWVVLAGAGIVGLSIITFIPALLVAAALPRHGSRQ